MNVQERRELYETKTPGMKNCYNCKHFFQHYVKTGIWGVSPIERGHCVYPRMKYRRTYDTCENWEERE